MTQHFIKDGSIEVIAGSMFSGKTEELIRRLRRAQYAKLSIQIFKPRLDNRFDDKNVVSHSGITITAVPVDHAYEMYRLVEGTTSVVGVDEAQFFDHSLPATCSYLARIGKRVIIAGLDTDFKGEPFGTIPTLMAIAETVTKTQAICVQCGSPASRTQKLVVGGDVVEIGASELYEARCRNCFIPGGTEK